MTKMVDKIRVPPKSLGPKLKESLLEICRNDYEGKVNQACGVIVAVKSVGKVGDGHIIPGDGSAYYEAEIEMLTYKPFLQEVVRGVVTEATEFGAFMMIGPIEGLAHISQVMDDFINYDAKISGFVGKKSSRKLVGEDSVIARVVSVSLKGDTASSKIGLTMRQEFLGKPEWDSLVEKEKGKKSKKGGDEETDKKETKGKKGKEDKE
jgi:DNA-directed RNA polymerase subunit E'